MSAFGGKADMAIGTGPLFRSLSGVKQTWAFAPHMSACDPKRTFCEASESKGRSLKRGNLLNAVVARFAFERLSLLTWLLGLDANEPHGSATACTGRMHNV